MENLREEPKRVAVAVERLARLQQAVTLAAEGSFLEALKLLAASEQDELGEVERTVRSFIKDYKLAIEQSALSVEEFAESRRELERKIEMIEEQQAAIQKLSAPIIDVWEGIVTVPLTGDLDSARMYELAKRLLIHIQSTQTSWVILDLTGTAQLDGEAGGSLLRLSSAVRLMGTECLLTGIGDSVARMLVTSGISLEGIRTVASLRQGLKYCLSRARSA
jgi:rsbT co-antagonist protein RsbR